MSTTDAMPFSPGLFPAPSVTLGAGPKLTQIPLSAFPLDLPGPRPGREFRRAVSRYGVVVPVVLEEDPNGQITHRNATFALLDGNRRVMAAREAGFETIPARVFGATTIGSHLTLALNGLRTANPVTEYEAIRELTRAGHSESDITRLTGFPASRLRARMQLGRLEPALFDALRRQAITQGIAEGAARLPVALQSELVDTLEATGKLTAKDLRAVRQASLDTAVASLPIDIFEPAPSVDVPVADVAGVATAPADWRDSVRDLLEEALRIAPATAEGRAVRAAIGAALVEMRVAKLEPSTASEAA
jgi:ParB-like chromosome segregation protein Spo0J